MTEKKRKSKRDFIGGCVFLCAGALLLFHCLYHQKNDAVQYPWGTSPYLSSTLLAGLLMLLSLFLLLRGKNKNIPEDEMTGEGRK